MTKNIDSRSTSLIEIASIADISIHIDFNDNSYDKLTVYKNDTRIYTFSNDTVKDINITSGDVLKIEYYKYYSSSVQDGNTTVTVK